MLMLRGQAALETSITTSIQRTPAGTSYQIWKGSELSKQDMDMERSQLIRKILTRVRVKTL